MSESALVIDGAARRSLSLGREQLAGFPEEARIADVSAVDERRQGEAVRLSALLAQAEPDETATHVTLHSSDGFSASIPLEDTRDVGVVIFQIDGQPLAESAGGPYRFLIPNAAACKTAELDACANVKALVRIELTMGRGRDTR